MPPGIIPLELPLAPKARSLRSKRATLRPRSERARATPVPFTPPPRTATSNEPSSVFPSSAIIVGAASFTTADLAAPEEGGEDYLPAHVQEPTQRFDPQATRPSISWAGGSN